VIPPNSWNYRTEMNGSFKETSPESHQSILRKKKKNYIKDVVSSLRSRKRVVGCAVVVVVGKGGIFAEGARTGCLPAWKKLQTKREEGRQDQLRKKTRRRKLKKQGS